MSDLAVLLTKQDEFLGFLRRRLAVHADAEDVLQQALLKAVDRVDAVRDADALVPWFYQVLRSTLVDHQRARVRQDRVVGDAVEECVLPPHEVGRCACSLSLLAELPHSYRDLLTKIDLREERVSSVAQELGLTENNTLVRLHRARRALREQIAACCGCTSASQCQSCSCCA